MESPKLGVQKERRKEKQEKKKILKHTQGNRVKIEVAAEVSVIN